MMYRIFSLIALLGFAGSVCTQTLEVRAYVETLDGKGVIGAVAEVYVGGTKQKTVNADSKGVIGIELQYGKLYNIVITKPGMIKKQIEFNTDIAEEKRKRLIKEFAMTLIEDCDGANTSVFNKPVDMIKFDDGVGNFVSDMDYVRGNQSRIMAAYASIEKCQKDKYREKISEADREFKATQYNEAIKFYEDALEIVPDDSYAKRQIAQARKNMEKQSQNQQRYDELISEGEQFMAQNQLSAAKQRFSSAVMLNPSDTKANAKLQEINQILAEQAQEAQQQQALNNNYNSAINKANAAMSSGNYALAKQLFEEAGKLKPNEALPAQKVALAQQALEKEEQNRIANEKLEKDYQEALAAGQAALQQENFTLAKQHFGSALALKPSEQMPRQKVQEVERLEEAKRQQELQVQRDELERNYSEAIQKADGLLAQKEFDNSVEAYKQALQLKPSDKYAQSQIKKATNLKVEEEQQKQVAIEQAYQQAMQNGDIKKSEKLFEEAIAAYQSALVSKPGDPNAQSKLSEAQKLLADQHRKIIEETEQRAKYNQLIQEGDSYFQGQDYNNSKARFQEALGIYPTEQYPKNKIAAIDNILAKNQKEAEYNQIIAQADQYFNQQEFDKAVTGYTKAKQVLPQKTYPQEKINEISKIKGLLALQQRQAEYDQLTANAETKIVEESFEEAKSLYAQASGILPENPYPQQRINEINDMISKKAKSTIEKEYNAIAAQAEQQVAQENYEEAKALYARASQVMPENGYPAKRINEINQMISDKAKSKKESEYNQLAVQAEEQIDQENFETAKSLYARASLVLPENTYPQQRINEINQMISARAKSAIEEEYNTVVAQAEQQVIQEGYKEAIALYTRASQIMPEKSYPQQRINEINEMISNRTKSRKETEYNQLAAQAEEQITQENYEVAKNLYKRASLVIPENPYPQKRINEINEIISNRSKNKSRDEFENLKAQAEQEVSGENYEAAKALLTKAGLLIPEDSYPQRRINEINQIISSNARSKVEQEYLAEITKADGYFDSEQFKLAISSYTAAGKIMPEKTYPQQRINEINSLLAEKASLEQQKADKKTNYDRTVALADKLFEDKNYSLARTEYYKAINIYPEESYPASQITKIEELLAEQQRIESDKRERERKFNEAVMEANRLFKLKHYPESKTYYKQALAINPSDAHSSSQIKRIDQIITDKLAENERLAEINEKYKNIIANADSKYGAQDYKQARILYYSALEVKPNEVYPREQIKKADARLKTLATKTVTNTTTTKTGSNDKKIEDVNFKNESERSKYLASLKQKYSPGITLEIYNEGNKTTKRYIVIRGDEVHEYRAVTFTWGGSQYTVDGKPSNQMYVRSQVKPREGENFIKKEM